MTARSGLSPAIAARLATPEIIGATMMAARPLSRASGSAVSDVVERAGEARDVDAGGAGGADGLCHRCHPLGIGAVALVGEAMIVLDEVETAFGHGGGKAPERAGLSPWGLSAEHVKARRPDRASDLRPAMPRLGPGSSAIIAAGNTASTKVTSSRMEALPNSMFMIWPGSLPVVAAARPMRTSKMPLPRSLMSSTLATMSSRTTSEVIASRGISTLCSTASAWARPATDFGIGRNVVNRCQIEHNLVTSRRCRAEERSYR